MFLTYKEVYGENLYLDNSLASNVLGIGKFILKMTSGKLLTSTMYCMLLTLERT